MEQCKTWLLVLRFDFCLIEVIIFKLLDTSVKTSPFEGRFDNQSMCCFILFIS